MTVAKEQRIAKLCPFCGGEPVQHTAAVNKGGALLYWIICKGCGALVRAQDNALDAWERWNRRTAGRVEQKEE